MIVWELRESSNGELKPYHSIMEPQPSYPVLDYEDETRRDRLQLFQAKNWGWWVFVCVAVIVIASVLCGRGWKW